MSQFASAVGCQKNRNLKNINLELHILRTEQNRTEKY